MNKLHILLILIVVIFSSCSDTISSKRKTFENYVWEQTDTLVVDFEIKEDTRVDLVVSLRYIIGYPFKNINLELLADDKKYPVIINVIDENNQYTGEIMGDLADKEQVVVNDTLLLKGKHKIKLFQNMANKLPFIGDIGVKVEKREG